MQLTGDLSDFALADILQILALSRKTGMVLLEGAWGEGKIVVESGRITHASVLPGGTLADSLAVAGLIGADALRALASGSGSNGQLEKLLTENGLLTRNGFVAAARRHTQRILGKLVVLEKGRFSIALGEAMIPHAPGGFRLADGIEVGEALLSAAHERDESYNEWEPTVDSLDEHQHQVSSSSNGDPTTRPLGTPGNNPAHADPAPSAAAENQDRSALLCSLLTEMKQNSFEAEVSLLIMRYASELATRGILFAVHDSKLWGLGQFGLGSQRDGKGPDAMVRELSFPWDADSLFGRVVETGEPYLGSARESHCVSEVLNRFGGVGQDVALFLLPLICNDSVAFVVYGDNYPGKAKLEGIGELVALASQASLVLERIALQRRVSQLESRSMMN